MNIASIAARLKGAFGFVTAEQSVTGRIKKSASGVPMLDWQSVPANQFGLMNPVTIANGASGWASDNETVTITNAGALYQNPDQPAIAYAAADLAPTADFSRVVALNLDKFKVQDSVTLALRVVDFPFSAPTPSIDIAFSSNNFSSKSIQFRFSDITTYRPDGLIFLTVGTAANGDRKNGERPGQVWEAVGGQLITDEFNAVRINLNRLQTKTVKLLGVYCGKLARGNVIIGHDDALISQYEIAYKTASERGIPLTIALPHARIGENGHCTQSMIDEMYKSGMVDFVGHTTNHTVLTGVALEVARAEVLDNRRYLLNKYPRGANCMVYTENLYNAAIRKMCRQVGYGYARSMNTYFIRAGNIGMDDQMSMGGCTLSAITLAVAKTYVDTAVNTGQTVWIYGHTILNENNPAGLGGPPPATSTHWYKDDWIALLDYIKSKSDDGLINAMSWSDFEASIKSVPSASF